MFAKRACFYFMVHSGGHARNQGVRRSGSHQHLHLNPQHGPEVQLNRPKVRYSLAYSKA